MAVISYHTVNGSILGQTAGGSRSDYLYDALGSVTATTDSNGAIQNRYRYKPYGATLSKTGIAPDPRFKWIGTLGYRDGGSLNECNYVRRRWYIRKLAVWSSVDPEWLDDQYVYASGSPVTKTDSSGLVPDDPTASHWKRVLYDAPSFYRCYSRRMRGTTRFNTFADAVRACKECKLNALPSERRYAPRDCEEFVRSNPVLLRSDPYTPQQAGYTAGLFRKTRFDNAQVTNRSKCYVRVCWREPNREVHCVDLEPGATSSANIDVDAICFCGKPYKIRDYSMIIIENNRAYRQPGTVSDICDEIKDPIFRDENIPDRDWFHFENACKEALAFARGDCCTDPRVRHR